MTSRTTFKCGHFLTRTFSKSIRIMVRQLCRNCLTLPGFDIYFATSLTCLFTTTALSEPGQLRYYKVDKGMHSVWGVKRERKLSKCHCTSRVKFCPIEWDTEDNISEKKTFFRLRNVTLQIDNACVLTLLSVFTLTVSALIRGRFHHFSVTCTKKDKNYLEMMIPNILLYVVSSRGSLKKWKRYHINYTYV